MRILHDFEKCTAISTITTPLSAIGYLMEEYHETARKT